MPILTSALLGSIGHGSRKDAATRRAQNTAILNAPMRRLLTLLLLVPTLALAQAAPNTSLALIGYGALKNRVKPQGELAVQIAGIDSAIRIAQRRGQTS